jgi:uncharacterized membrane protein YfcA
MNELSAMQTVLSLIAICGVAFLYSSVGYGGATGYLAAATLLGIAPVIARPCALWLNCCVATIAFWRFSQAGYFNWRVFLPLAVVSVPLAWLGSRLHLDGRPYAIVLGLALATAGWLLGWGHAASDAPPRPVGLPTALGVGGALGFLAGLTGIGGGVFLTPLLIFLRWTTAKTAGGISALFILVNSIAGLVGLGKQALISEPAFIAAPVVGVAGALAGTHLGVKRWSTVTFRRVLAGVLWIAAAKLLFFDK